MLETNERNFEVITAKMAHHMVIMRGCEFDQLLSGESQLKMATSFRFGSTIDPCRTAAAERAVLLEDEEISGKEAHLDPDTLLQCPFDKNHLIRVCRFPYHLIKCRKNHPKLASELKTCPYNARHLADNAAPPFVWGVNTVMDHQ
ncbi:hypothetical protein F7725_001351 [Dissostichus mawsoni]|uniref:CHHC U11-48K-type domain-containing protein n=1 Tax=Dissostichus mawsoni TaxID=36200 RepID=A0A7J5ZHK2_DISMA|nr:hypothetical protein F7725_001351 [Dissostichus mawsoni]